MDFILKARKVHGDRYDYSKVEYVKAIQNVIITCKQHGEFLQRPSNHLTGYGCRKCGGSAPVTHDELVERATAVRVRARIRRRAQCSLQPLKFAWCDQQQSRLGWKRRNESLALSQAARASAIRARTRKACNNPKNPFHQNLLDYSF